MSETYCVQHEGKCFDVRCEICPNRKLFYPVKRKPAAWGLVYLGTPYSNYFWGLDAAANTAAWVAGKMLKAGYSVYSPIAHGHQMSLHADIDPLDHSIWLPYDAMMMDKADALFVALMNGWDKSRGITHEIEAFRDREKPIRYINPDTLEVNA